jgi:O-antigen/teichoic acid export membrane protein
MNEGDLFYPMSDRSFLRHTAIYGLGNVLVQASAFLLLPLYTRALNPAEYGTLEVLNRIGELAVVCLLFNGFRQAVFAFHCRATSPEEKTRVVASTCAGLALLGALGVVVGLIGVPIGASLCGVEAKLLALALSALLLEGAANVLMVLPQARVESGLFVTLTVSSLLARITFSVLFVPVLGWGIFGVLAASVLTAGGVVTVLLVRELARGHVRPSLVCLRSMAHFAFPFLPVGLGFFIINHGDRFVLLRYAGEGEVGIYSLGYKLAMAVGIFSRTPPFMVWSARMYEVARREDAADIFGRVITGILGLYLFVGMGLCFFQNEVVALLSGGRYAAATQVIAPIVLAYLFMAAADLMDGAFFVTGRTSLKTPIALASTVIVCILYAVLIPNFGAAGAAAATLAGCMAHAVFTFFVSRRVFAIRLEPGRLAALLGLAMAMTAVAWALPGEWWAIPLKALWLLSAPVILWFGGFFHEDERAMVSSVLGKVAGRSVWAAEGQT